MYRKVREASGRVKMAERLGKIVDSRMADTLQIF